MSKDGQKEDLRTESERKQEMGFKRKSNGFSNYFYMWSGNKRHPAVSEILEL